MLTNLVTDVRVENPQNEKLTEWLAKVAIALLFSFKHSDCLLKQSTKSIRQKSEEIARLHSENERLKTDLDSVKWDLTRSNSKVNDVQSSAE